MDLGGFGGPVSGMRTRSSPPKDSPSPSTARSASTPRRLTSPGYARSCWSS